jgi:hypothetical protein
MSDVSGQGQSATPPRPPEPEWPQPQFPVIFADGVLSTAWGRGVVKFYFYRTDPEFRATPNSGGRDTPFAEVVMTVSGFAAMVIHFQRTLETLVQQNEITEVQVNQIRQAYGQQVNAV